jgi:hypothetical protein
LDFIGSAAQGDILYRGASDWVRLAASSDDDVLTLASGIPSWAAPSSPITIVASGSISSAATLDIDLSGGAGMYEIELMRLLPQTDNVSARIRLSQSGVFLTGSADYRYHRVTNGTDSGSVDLDYVNFNSSVGNAAGEGLAAYTIKIFRPAASPFLKTFTFTGGAVGTVGNAFGTYGHASLIANSNAIDGLRVYFSSGNIASGYYAVRAVNFS